MQIITAQANRPLFTHASSHTTRERRATGHRPSQPNVYIQTVNPPFPLPQQAPQPLHPYARPLAPRLCDLVRRLSQHRIGGGIEHVPRDERGGVGSGAYVLGGERVEDRRGIVEAGGIASEKGDGSGPGLEPVAAEVEEAPIGPVARGHEQDQQQEGAVDAGPVEEVGAHEEEEDEGRRGVGRDEEEGQPAAEEALLVSPCLSPTLVFFVRGGGKGWWLVVPP